jgi:hypothetical protein
MPVSTLMGWGLLGLLLLLVVALVMVLLISGSAGKQAAGRHAPPGPAVPVNVFQRGLIGSAATGVPVLVPGHWSLPSGGQGDPGGPWAAPRADGA